MHKRKHGVDHLTYILNFATENGLFAVVLTRDNSTFQKWYYYRNLESF